MTWNLREEVLLAKWREEGHEFRRMNVAGAVACLRCNAVVHVRSRARCLVGDGEWNGDPAKVPTCKPKITVFY
jgi:hypothetical protein